MTGVTLLPFLATLLGCGTPDYGLAISQDEGAQLDWIETNDSTAIQISFDAAFQRTNYGKDIGRCQVQLAFLLEWEEDGMGSDTDEPNHDGEDAHGNPRGPTPRGGGPQAVGQLEIVYAQHGHELVLPDEPGDCVLSVFDYDGDHQGQEACDEHPEDGDCSGSEGGDASHDHHEGPSDGAWMVRGSIDLGPEILLAGNQSDVWLDRSQDEEGRVFYQLQHCDESSFPFAQTFDLAIPHALEQELGELMVAEAFAIGPELSLVRPGYELTDRGVLEHAQNKDLSIAWEVHDDAPEMGGRQVPDERMIWIQTQRREDWRFEEALACMPYEGTDHFLIPREIFLEMKSDSPGTEDPVYESSFQVDLRSRAEPAAVEWAELGRVSSTVTDGGIFRLETASR